MALSASNESLTCGLPSYHNNVGKMAHNASNESLTCSSPSYHANVSKMPDIPFSFAKKGFDDECIATLLSQVEEGEFDDTAPLNAISYPALKAPWHLKTTSGSSDAAALVAHAVMFYRGLRSRFPIAKTSHALLFMKRYIESMLTLEKHGEPEDLLYWMCPPREGLRPMAEFCWWYSCVVKNLAETMATIKKVEPKSKKKNKVKKKGDCAEPANDIDVAENTILKINMSIQGDAPKEL